MGLAHLMAQWPGRLPGDRIWPSCHAINQYINIIHAGRPVISGKRGKVSGARIDRRKMNTVPATTCKSTPAPLKGPPRAEIWLQVSIRAAGFELSLADSPLGRCLTRRRNPAGAGSPLVLRRETLRNGSHGCFAVVDQIVI